MEQDLFEELLQRTRQGDQDAVTELVRLYEPEVRRFVRFRMTNPTMRRFLDSLDISQSVFGRFLVDIQNGAFEVTSPAQLRNLLLTMARNKLYDNARYQQAAKRDRRRTEAASSEGLEQISDPGKTPSAQLAADELVAAVRAELAPDELYLIDERLNGRDWNDLAAELQVAPDAARKRMTRAIDRVAQQLGLVQ